MNELRFEWNADKAARNLRKHGISFDEATTVFDDPNVLREFDRTHSHGEEREIAIGFSENARLLQVVSTERHETIRLISARRATKAESRRYAEQGYGPLR
jgi:uncharacterized DUF497 family protein